MGGTVEEPGQGHLGVGGVVTFGHLGDDLDDLLIGIPCLAHAGGAAAEVVGDLLLGQRAGEVVELSCLDDAYFLIAEGSTVRGGLQPCRGQEDCMRTRESRRSTA